MALADIEAIFYDAAMFQPDSLGIAGRAGRVENPGIVFGVGGIGVERRHLSRKRCVVDRAGDLALESNDAAQFGEALGFERRLAVPTCQVGNQRRDVGEEALIAETAKRDEKSGFGILEQEFDFDLLRPGA